MAYRYFNYNLTKQDEKKIKFLSLRLCKVSMVYEWLYGELNNFW